jgi:hypothetical protein
MSKPKFYLSNEHTGLGTYHPTNVGSLIAQLKLALCDGFNLKSVSTLTRTSTTANVYVSTGHGFKDKQVVLIAGANETAYNGEYEITYVDANNFTYTVAGSPATPATGTITAKAASLGWTAIYSTSDTLIVQSPAGEGCLYRLYEPANGVVPWQGGDLYPAVQYRAVEVNELWYGDSSGNYIETCRGYIYKGMSGAGSSSAQWGLVGDDRGFHVLVQDPYDVFSGGTRAAYHKYQPYYFGELVCPQTYDELPFRSGMLADTGYNTAANYGYDSHSPIGTTSRASGSPVGNSSNYWWRSGKSFGAARHQQPLVLGDGQNGQSYRLWGIRRGWPVILDPWDVTGSQGTGRHFSGPFTGQQQIHMSSPWMLYVGSYLLGKVPGVATVNWMPSEAKGYEFLSPYASSGATNRTGLVIRGFWSENHPSGTGGTQIAVLGTGQFLGNGGSNYVTLGFDLTGEWR